MRVYEIAKEYELKTKEILDFLQSMGVNKTAVSLLDRDTLNRILIHYGKTTKNDGADAGRSAHTLSDHWTLYDSLGYEPYAYALFRFLVHEQSQPPLTVSVQAPWGGGKTSMMRMIQNHLDPNAAEDTIMREMENRVENQTGATVGQIVRALSQSTISLGKILAEDEALSRLTVEMKDLINAVWDYLCEPFRSSYAISRMSREFQAFLALQNADPLDRLKKKEANRPGVRRFTVWFNAWKYQSAGYAWAGLLDAIVRQIGERMRPRQRECFLLELHLHRVGRDSLRKQILTKIAAEFWRAGQWMFAGMGISVVGLLASSWLGWIHIANFIAVLCLANAACLVAHFAHTFHRFRNQSASDQLSEFMEPPDYRKDRAPLNAMEKDLRTIFEVLRNPSEWMHPQYQKYVLPMTIFVDDLDRCAPDQIADVIEAMNRFMSGDFPETFFVLGMDAEIGAAALELSHQDSAFSLPGKPDEKKIGWRFMDKFVQLPFDIPPPISDNLINYTRNLLDDPVASEGMKWAREVVWNSESPVDSGVDSEEIADRILDELLECEDDETERKLRDLLRAHLKEDIQWQRRERAILDEGIRHLNDGKPEFQKMILERAPRFSSNPREIKRLLNVFRFRCLLWRRRKEHDLPNASLDQLMRWVEFSLKWPHVARWLQRAASRENKRTGARETPDGAIGGLANLEKIAQTPPPQRAAQFLERFGVDSLPISWINDESLMEFFQEELKRPADERLSACEGTGLF